MPKVSVIIPYNKDRGWLEKAMDSVYHQDYGDVELILSNSPYGVSFNINEGVMKSTGEYVKYLCDDDWLPPDSISNSVKAMEGVDFIHGNCISVRAGKEINLHIPKKTIFSHKELARHNYIHGATLMYRRDVFDRFGVFDEEMWTGEELEFNLRILSKGAKVGYCDHVVAYYRLHSRQKSIGNKSTSHRNKRIAAITSMRKKYR